MSWEHDGFRSFYDVRPRRRHYAMNRDDRQRTARIMAMLAGWPQWMANIEGAVTA